MTVTDRRFSHFNGRIIELQEVDVYDKVQIAYALASASEQHYSTMVCVLKEKYREGTHTCAYTRTHAHVVSEPDSSCAEGESGQLPIQDLF